MKKRKSKSLQEIEDFYIRLGYKGDKLREALSKDRSYQRLLKERRQRLTKAFNISAREKKTYVLSTDADFEILRKCKELEKLDLSKEDKFLVKLIKSQLKEDWRKPLMKALNKLLKKYDVK